jgi:hypothetical protein
VKRIVRYVAGTLDHGLFYPRFAGEAHFVGYSDSDHAGDINTSKSTSGILFPWQVSCQLAVSQIAGGCPVQLLTPKFGKESDLWVRFEKESVWWKEGYFQRFSAKRSAVGYLLRFGKGTVELILRDWTMTWLNQGRRMDG